MAKEWPHRSRLLRRSPRAAGQLIMEDTKSTDGVAQGGTESARTCGWFATGTTSGACEAERLRFHTRTSVGHSWAQPAGPHRPTTPTEGIVADAPVRNHVAAVPAIAPESAAITGEDAMYNIAAIPSADLAIEASVFGDAEHHVAALTEFDAADLERPTHHWSHDGRGPVSHDRRLLDRH